MLRYHRVIPRDLFNEANLLKCYGRLWICLDETPDHRAELRHDDRAFLVSQDQTDGTITIVNIGLFVGAALTPVRLYRPLNSRAPWPLWAVRGDEDIAVFTPGGDLTPEFLALIRAP